MTKSAQGITTSTNSDTEAADAVNTAWKAKSHPKTTLSEQYSVSPRPSGDIPPVEACAFKLSRRSIP
jgi:hypothetical protein